MAQQPNVAGPAFDATTLTYVGEKHLVNVRQLTFGGIMLRPIGASMAKALCFRPTTRNGAQHVTKSSCIAI